MPSDAKSWYEAGRAALLRSFSADSVAELQDDLREGLEALERALAQDPNHEDAAVDRALALAWLDRPAEAALELAAVRARAPGRADLHLAEARALQLAGRWSEAAAAFSVLLVREPTSAHARWWLAEALEELGRPAEAEVIWPESADPAEPVAQLARSLQRLAPSLPSPSERLLRRGAALERAGQPAEATFADAFAQMPSLTAWNPRLESVLRQHPTARRAFAAALRQRWEDPQARRALAEAQLRAGELAEALEAALAWAEAEPRADRPRGLLAEILVRLGRTDEARARWEEALALNPGHLGYRARAAACGIVLDVTEE